MEKPLHGRGIRAARDRTGDTAAFQTNGHCFLLPQHLRAAKWHFYPDTIRPRTARNLRTRTPQGDGNNAPCLCSSQKRNNLRTRTPQGDGNSLFPFLHPRVRESQFKNQNPARGRKLFFRKALNPSSFNLRTRTPQGDGNDSAIACKNPLTRNLRTRTPQGDGNVIILHAPYSFFQKFKNQNPARGRKRYYTLCIASCTHKFKNQNRARGRKLLASDPANIISFRI